MRLHKPVICLFLAAGTTAFIGGPARAQDDRDRDEDRRERREGERAHGREVVDKALAQMYPDASHDVREPKTVNGIRVYDVDIRTNAGQNTFAQVTEYGDFLVSGVPATAEAAPAAVREATEGLFRDAPDTDAFLSTSYYVYIRAPGGEDYQVRLDAAGRLLDIRSLKELHAEVPEKRESAPDSEHNRLVEAARSRFGEVEIKEMFRSPDAPGVYTVTLTRDGRKGFVTVGENNAVYSQRTDIDTRDLPEPVVRTVRDVFSADIRNAEKGETQYWQFRQRVGDDTLTLKIRPTGEIMDVTSDNPIPQDERAATAGARDDRRSSDDDRDRERDRERDRDRDRRDDRRD